MRTHTIDITLSSDIDLRLLACRRIQIDLTGKDLYRITSPLRLYRCERHSFVDRLLHRRRPGCQAYSGNASAPRGYYWHCERPGLPAGSQHAAQANRARSL